VLPSRESAATAPQPHRRSPADAGGDALLAASRRDLRLVMIEGRPLVADADLAPIFTARRVTARPLGVDGAQKIADAGVVRRVVNCPISEPGVAAA
jgi:hypothetical protein